LSYRTFKHLVGETSLERKCRFIFGGGILALVSLSFCWYGQKTESLVIGQKTEGARLLVGPVLQKFHTKKLLIGQNTQDLIDEWADDHSSLNENPGYDSHLITPFQPRDEEHLPRDDFEAEVVASFLRAAAREGESAHQPMVRRTSAFLDGTPSYRWQIVAGRKEYQYVEAVLFKPSCIDCHKSLTRIDPASGKHVFARPYDLAAAVVVKLPMDKTNKDINRNRAILISTAMVTALLAMLASWTIFRYIIAKPVKHLRDVCEGLTSLARPIAEKKSIDLQCRLDDAIPLLRQDAGKIRQILYNLLSNAIKFTPEGGRVTLSVRVEGRQVVLEVEDTGVGIAEDDRERIFEKFRQAGIGGAADGVLTREHAGTGLGLSIVRELSKLLGGDVGLESELGRGSKFTIRLPMQLPGHRKFEVTLSDERIDLSKARRVELRAAPGPLLRVGLGAAPPKRGTGEPPPA
jgi:hypothetical protein